MIFKNARIFRFTKPIQVSAERLDEVLQGDAFKPCGPQETSRQGWVPPMGKLSEQLVHAANGYLLICLQRQEKLLPSSVVNDYVNEKVDAIEHDQSRKVRRKERNEIKEQVTLELLPQAFCRNRNTYGYLDLSAGFLVVDASSAKVAEEFASALRKTLGSLPVRPVTLEQSPAFTFTGWVNETLDLPAKIVLGEDCWMADPSQDGGKIIARGLDLASDEVRSHLDAGMQATKLTLTWDDSVSFCLDEDLAITRVRFGDELLEKLDEVDVADAAARFDSAFCLMTLELSRLIPGLIDAMGGEDRTAIIEGEASDMLANAATPVEGEKQQRLPAGDTEAPDYEDALYHEAVSFVVSERRVSISGVQRRFKIGYNRAANIVEAMEKNGVVSGADHHGQRTILIAAEVA